MKKFIYFFMFLFPISLFAESSWYEFSEDTIFILNTYSLISAVLVGLIASILVWRNARSMKGGLLGKVLGYFTAGMIVALVAYIVNAYGTFAGGRAALYGVSYDVLFIASYIIMAIAAQKLSSITGVR